MQSERQSMKRERRLVVAKPVSVEPIFHLRHEILHLLHDEDVPPDLAFGVLISIAGTIAATGKVGRWRMLWRCWRVYGVERKRLVAERVKEITR